MSNEPLVSLVIPVLNGERHLEACMTSVLDQTYRNIEVIVSDNASTDGTAGIVRSFDDPRVRILPNPADQLSLPANWARGIEATRGEFLKIVCHDDLLFPDCLAVQTDLLLQNPSAVVVGGRRRIIDDQDDVLIKARGLGHLAKSGGTQVVTGGALARACTRAGANLLGEPASVLIRRSAVPEPLFDPRWLYAIDFDFYMRCLRRSDAVLDSRVLCSFRVSPNQLSATLATGQARELKAFFSELARRYPEHVSDSDVRLGTTQARLLSRARRVLYWYMRSRAIVARWRRSESLVSERR